MTTLEKNYQFSDQYALHSSKLIIFSFLPIHFILLSDVVLLPMLSFCVLPSSYLFSGLHVELFPFKVIINLDLLECCKFICILFIQQFYYSSNIVTFSSKLEQSKIKMILKMSQEHAFGINTRNFVFP